MNCEKENVFTIEDYLASKVKFNVPRKAVVAIFVDRGLDGMMPVSSLDEEGLSTLRLCYADLLKWFVIGPSKVNNTSDSDNGWTHTAGGYELSEEDIAEMKAEANAIYGELEPDSVFAKKSSFKVTSFGVMRANRGLNGAYLPHVIR